MALRCAIFNLEDAYKNFFAKRGNYPVFKAKRSYQSYKTNCIVSSYKNNTYSNIKIDLEKRQIKLPKLGLVNIRGYRNKKELVGRIISAQVMKEATGKYYVSVIALEEALIKEKVIPSKAIELLKTKNINKVLVTGGIGVNGDFNEAEYMKEHLLEIGVKESDILIEDKSTTTEENITNSIKILKDNIS